ncbi:MAG: GtrA family protein [Hyphomonadaceae bacterium]
MNGQTVRAIASAPLARQITRFLGVGVIGTLIHYGVLILCVEGAKMTPVLGTTFGFITAAFVSYALNRRYTFDVRPAFGVGLMKSYVALGFGLVINAGTVALLTKLGVQYLFAQAIATGLALCWNFTASRLVVFR